MTSALQMRPATAVPVVLALGANLGDPLATLTTAVDELAAVEGLEPRVVSPLARTEPVGGPDQPAYLNAVVLARTSLSPLEVLRAAQSVEQRAGRERLVRWGPRTLDVDLVQYGAGPAAVLSADAELTLPHPRARERAFVLWPWGQADPAAQLDTGPGTAVNVVAAAALAPDRSGLGPGPPWPEGSLAARLERAAA